MREMNDMKTVAGKLVKNMENIGKKGLQKGVPKCIQRGMQKEAGIDGILVTIGLCIIALVLCVVMKDSLATFINTIVGSMTEKASAILQGV